MKVIAGAANNQLADENKHGKRLQERGIVYAPDFLINAGGIINVYAELENYGKTEIIRKAENIYDTTLEIFAKAQQDSSTTHEAALKIALQIVYALSHCHRQGITHCDLKPANVMLAEKLNADNDPIVKLVDFGLALEFDPNDEEGCLINGHGGSYEYMPPEQLRGELHDTTKCDIYAVGVILYEMLCGKILFSTDGDEDNVNAHLKARSRIMFNEERWNSVNEDVIILIMLVLEKDPALRLSADELIDYLLSFNVFA